MFVAGPCTNQPRFADGRVADEDTFYQLLVGLLVVHASIGGTIPHFWNDSSSGLAAAVALSLRLCAFRQILLFSVLFLRLPSLAPDLLLRVSLIFFSGKLVLPYPVHKTHTFIPCSENFPPKMARLFLPDDKPRWLHPNTALSSLLSINKNELSSSRRRRTRTNAHRHTHVHCKRMHLWASLSVCKLIKFTYSFHLNRAQTTDEWL